MLKILKNTTVVDVFIKDTGVLVPASGEYIIQPQDYPLWTPSEDVVTLIVNNTIVVNDGQDNLTNKRVAIALIQDNQIVINEYYTLVQDDDVLIGNGQILYLNDDFDTTNNVPQYLYEEQIIEDD